MCRCVHARPGQHLKPTRKLTCPTSHQPACPASAYIDGTMTGYAFGTDGRAINMSEAQMRPVAMHAFDQVRGRA